MASPCTVPWPARAFGALQPLFDPGPQAIPACCAGLRRPSGQDQPRIVVASSQHARTGPETWGRVQARPTPRPRVPGRGTQGRQGRQPGAPAGRTLPPVLLRTNGGHPRCVLRRNNQGADTPRSTHTSTIQPWGLAGRRCRHSRSVAPAPPGVYGAGAIQGCAVTRLARSRCPCDTG